MRTIGVALAGAAVIFSLGAPYTTQVLAGGAAGFGGVVAALGTGMGLGVVVFGLIGDRLPKGWVSAVAVICAGLMLTAASAVSSLGPAIILAGLFGAGGGIAYATGFALLQERVAASVRGRTFASVQIVIRVSIFTSLVVFPALAGMFATDVFFGTAAEGIRFSMALGGLITVAAGALAALDVYKGKVRA
jgi:dTMP kinase